MEMKEALAKVLAATGATAGFLCAVSFVVDSGLYDTGPFMPEASLVVLGACWLGALWLIWEA